MPLPNEQRRTVLSLLVTDAPFEEAVERAGVQPERAREWIAVYLGEKAALGAAEVPTRVSSDVEIIRDQRGVPHIFATNPADLFMALGYAEAQDRLWQLDYLRRQAHGRLSEVFGSETLQNDILSRTLDITGIAEETYRRLGSESRVAVDAFASGVNAWLAALPAGLPVEFELLGYEPEPWQPQDSLAVVRRWWWYLTGRLHVLTTPEIVRAAVGDGERFDAFSAPDPALSSADFLLREERPPTGFEDLIEGIVNAERLRLVEALIGFTRIESPTAFGGDPDEAQERRVRLSRAAPTWVPATEVRGEGIFLRLREEPLRAWEEQMRASEFERFNARLRTWQKLKGRTPSDDHDAGFFRTLLLHTLSHALMRQLALECGYAVASIGERIYAAAPEEEHGPMAGVLLYTAAPDSEGTLGGLVRLGKPASMGHHLTTALREARLCASDPHCAEHEPDDDQWEHHWAACHACLFVPETSCSMGNRHLDRSMLVETFTEHGVAYFRPPA